MEESSETILCFDDFEVDSLQRRLSRRGEVIHLKPKTFDLLLTLLERRGEILSKNDLLDLVWENQYIEENNLTVHVAALRKALGETKDNHRFIVTVPGRGYRFIGKLNPPPSENFVIESQQIQRITIEEEEKKGQEQKKRAWSLRKIFLFAFSPLLLCLMIGGFLLWQAKFKSNAVFEVGSIKRLTTSGKVGFAAALSPDGKLFAYSLREEDGKESLWLGHADGGEPIQILAPTKAVFWSLTFAPDASSLYYTLSPDLLVGTLYRLPVFGGTPEKIGDIGRNSVSFAPDGKRFVYVRDDRDRGKTHLIVGNTENTDERELTPGNFKFEVESPTWSPDGESVAVALISTGGGKASSEIYLVNVSDGAMKPLTAHGWTRIRGIRWLHDGSGLVVVAIDKDSINSQVWHVSASSGEDSRIVNDLNAYTYAFGLSTDNRELMTVQTQPNTNIWVAPASDLTRVRQLTFGSIGRGDGGVSGINWTTDGRILYTAIIDKKRTIWTMEPDGKNQKQLIPSGGNNVYPSASRDGRYIVFQSNRGGKFAIWRADANGANLVQLTKDEEAAGEPTISPDGKWVVYVTSPDFLGTLYRIPIEGGEPVRLTENPAAWASFSPDGQTIACAYSLNGGMRLALISSDGGEPLKLFNLPDLSLLRPGVRWLPDGKSVTYGDADSGLWQQNLDGGEPQRVTNLPPERIFSHGWSPSGELLAFARGTESRDIVLIENKQR